MRNILKLTLLAASLTFPAAVYADSDGAVGGAVAGGAAGAVVGGPVGAAVGAGVGGVAGSAASGRDHDKVIIEHREVEPRSNAGCSTTTKQQSNEMGDTKTSQRTDC